MSQKIKISRELAEVLEEASNDVARWQHWQRSLDPQASSDCSKEDEMDDSQEADSAA